MKRHTLTAASRKHPNGARIRFSFHEQATMEHYIRAYDPFQHAPYQPLYWAGHAVHARSCY